MPQPIVCTRPASCHRHSPLSPDQISQRRTDYHHAEHLAERERFAALALAWGCTAGYARDWCRMNRLYATEADRQQQGRIESRHELRQWWLERIAC